jgi:hypothetical protein
MRILLSLYNSPILRGAIRLWRAPGFAFAFLGLLFGVVVDAVAAGINALLPIYDCKAMRARRRKCTQP